jgi:hypothetical protein
MNNFLELVSVTNKKLHLIIYLLVKDFQQNSVRAAESEKHDGELSARIVRTLHQPQDVLNHLKQNQIKLLRFVESNFLGFV